MSRPLKKLMSRSEIADATEALLDGHLSYEDYLEQVPEAPDDDLVAAVLDLVEHIPKSEGVFGVGEIKQTHYVKEVREAVDRLRLGGGGSTNRS